MKQIALHAATSVLTVAAWTILSGDLGQAAGVTILYWLIFWVLAEAAERRKDGKRVQAGRSRKGGEGQKRNQKTA